MPKKTVSLLLALLLLLLCGCTAQTPADVSGKTTKNNASAQSENKASKKIVSLACSITDSFCPYTAKTVLNRQLAPLMYESLVTLDDNYTAKKLLAENITINGTAVSVTIKNVSFTDGKTLTANDVVYCAKKAMEGKTRYASALSGVESVTAVSDTQVNFVLKTADPYFENQLDFPIYEAQSETKISSDNIAIPPIGCGRYYVSEDKTELKRNENYHGTVGGVKTIKLVDTPDNDALVHNLEVENVTCYYSDLSDSSISQIRGNYKSVNLNNLVYLGANMKSGLMKYYEMRRLVSSAIDRDEICNTAYYQNAEPATGIFNPKWAETQSVMQNFIDVSEDNIYLEILKEIGYNKKNGKGYYVNSDGEELTLTLVNYSENKWRTSAAKLVQSNLKDAGIKVKISDLDWKEYCAALKNKQFDLYIAEVKIGNNMDVSQLIVKGGSAAYGIDYKTSKKSDTTSAVSDVVSTQSTVGGENSSTAANTVSSAAATDDAVSSETSSDNAVAVTSGDTAAAIKKFYEGSATLNDIVTAFSYEMPIIPVCYRKGILSYTSDLSGFNPSYGNVYAGIENIN